MSYKQKKFGAEIKRRDYSKISGSLELPNLVEIQTDSFDWLIQEGLEQVFKDVFPIKSNDGKLELQYLSNYFKPADKSIQKVKEDGGTYSQKLYSKLRLVNKETGEIKDQDVFYGDFPMMTPKGTFVINGAERVIVSQLVRSPGAYFGKVRDKSNIMLYTGSIIPTRGAWLEYESDAKEVFNVRIDKTRKFPMTTLLLALGMKTADIKKLLGETTMILNTLEKDSSVETFEDALKEVYGKVKPGEPATRNGAIQLLVSKFFDARRYDLAKAGRYKLNIKLSVSERIYGKFLAEDITDENGKILMKKGTHLIEEDFKKAKEILNAGQANMVELRIAQEFGQKQFVQVVKVLEEFNSKKPISVVGNNPTENSSTVTVADVVASVSYISNISQNVGICDDIDHLGNRRIRCAGELIQNQFRIGVARIERVVKEKMSISNADEITPKNITNIRPLTAAIREFFTSSQLSQFMDQMNPLSELSNKRRLSALGPGGLSRDRAGFEVRDVHYSHYGRMCPIETPEGPNIGLINNLATYAKVDQYGFITTPYRTVQKAGKSLVVTDESKYLTADEEYEMVIAGANISLNEDGVIQDKEVIARYRGENVVVPKERVQLVDVSPKQILSIASACIPFLENDDATRAAMGANMQRQAVPLLKPAAPIVGTGVEHVAAKYSGLALVSEVAGTVEYVDGNTIKIKEKTKTTEYNLTKFVISNQGTVVNQTPIVAVGDTVKKGDIIADGPAMEKGELALGQNVLVAFMTWSGYNYEDAIIMSERMVKDDVYTSLHLEEYTIEVRETKLGEEKITAEIPNVSDAARKFLDERGVIRVGTEVKEGDILVGKTTPKGSVELSPEEKLLMAIFGDKSKNVKDSSLRVPHGGDGIVHDIKFFNSKDHNLPTGVTQAIKVYIIQKRKIKEGDKMAGRHGNKGVISRILPIEDMPIMPDGRPVDIMLNPLGVPSRMNIGQVLELHLGMAAKTLGVHIATPVFEGVNNKELEAIMAEAKMDADGKVALRDGRTGEFFDDRVSVGIMYMVKLSHMVDDKLHARSTGPYSLITQQPLGGKAQKGGQRFGEMEVWALEAYGAAHTLQEILTVKSDDISGRTKIYDAIIRGNELPEAGIPESFRVLQKELQALGINVKMMENGHEVDMKKEEAKERAELVVEE